MRESDTLPSYLILCLWPSSTVQGRCFGQCRSITLAAAPRRVPPPASRASPSISSRASLVTFRFFCTSSFCPCGHSKRKVGCVSFPLCVCARARVFFFLLFSTCLQREFGLHGRCALPPLSSLPLLPTRLCPPPPQTVSIHARILGSTPSKGNDEVKKKGASLRRHTCDAGELP